MAKKKSTSTKSKPSAAVKVIEREIANFAKSSKTGALRAARPAPGQRSVRTKIKLLKCVKALLEDFFGDGI
jgi:hypothetical protein